MKIAAGQSLLHYLRRGRTARSLALLLLCPAAGHSMAPDSTAATAPSELARILAEVETGTLLKVRTREQVLLQGVLVSRDADRFVLGVDVLDDVSMDASRVETLWIDAGDKSAQGMGWGALLGGVVGAAFFGYLAVITSYNVTWPGVGMPALYGGLFFGAPVGALFGALIGREYHHWRETYPEPPLAGGNGSR